MIYLRRVFKRITEKAGNASEIASAMIEGMMYYYENNCKNTKHLERLLGV